MQWRSAANSAKSASHHGGFSRRAARLSAWFRARSGCRCQQRPHSNPSRLGASAPHAAHGWAGRGTGPGFEQEPHQPVVGRMNPGRPHRGQGRFAVSASRRRRQARQRTLDLKRSTWPQSIQVLEQVTQRLVSGANRRTRPHVGQHARRAASASAARQRWHSSVPLRPIPLPHRTQSAILIPAAWSVLAPPWVARASASPVW